MVEGVVQQKLIFPAGLWRQPRSGSAAPRPAWIGAALGAILAALLGFNLALAPTFAFGGLYGLTVCAAAWLLGFGPAVLLGAVALTASTMMNGAGGPFGGSPLPPDSLSAWLAVGLRAISLLAVSALVARVRERYALVSRQADRDPLTGLYNHRAFREHLELAIARAERGDAVVALAYLDLDDFKGINDRLGHVAGDDLLRTFARAARAGIRRTDCVGRLGGDEFAIAIHARDRREALAAVHRAHDAIRQSLADEGGLLSFSMGAVVAGPSPDVDGSSLIHAADDLMYRAKRSAKGSLSIADFRASAAAEPHVSAEAAAFRAAAG